jgi:L,D-transpeptidase ErfK/SrfK
VTKHAAYCKAAVLLCLVVATSSLADNPEVPPRDLHPHPLHADLEQNVVGDLRVHEIAADETFLDIARRESLGYNELIAANPDVDPWLPRAGSRIVLPTQWILPPGPREGLVVNIPEMRLYYYLPGSASEVGKPTVISYPVGLGRDEWRTPLAEFRVRGKTKNPVWVLPETVKAERIAEKGFAEQSIPGGHPDNPLGRHRIELTLGAYAIHGTNKNWGVGMQVSHGCIRLYPEDVAALFPLVSAGTKGRFDYKPVKVGVREGRVLAEVHEDIYGLTPWLWSEALEAVRAAGLDGRVDFAKLRAVVEAATGIPTDVGQSRWPSSDPVRMASPASGEDDTGAVVFDARAEPEYGEVP